MFAGALKVTKYLGLVAGSLSMVLLIRYGWHFGLTSSFRAALGFYEVFVNALLGWADDPLKQLLANLRYWIGADLHLHSFWKHVFVLMWLYFSGIGKAHWNQGESDIGIFSIVWGGLVALVSSVASGTIAFDGVHANILVMAFPLAGFAIFEIGRSIFGATVKKGGATLREGIEAGTIGRWYVFGFRLRQFLLPTVIFAGLALAFGLSLANITSDGAELNSNILTLIVFVAGLIFYWFGRGLVLAISDRQYEESPTHRFLRSGAVQFGILMLNRRGQGR
jgi:hypothetical protein